MSDHAVSIYHLVVFISEGKYSYKHLKHQAHAVSCNVVSYRLLVYFFALDQSLNNYAHSICGIGLLCGILISRDLLESSLSLTVQLRQLPGDTSPRRIHVTCISQEYARHGRIHSINTNGHYCYVMSKNISNLLSSLIYTSERNSMDCSYSLNSTWILWAWAAYFPWKHFYLIDQNQTSHNLKINIVFRKRFFTDLYLIHNYFVCESSFLVWNCFLIFISSSRTPPQSQYIHNSRCRFLNQRSPSGAYKMENYKISPCSSCSRPSLHMLCWSSAYASVLDAYAFFFFPIQYLPKRKTIFQISVPQSNLVFKKFFFSKEEKAKHDVAFHFLQNLRFTRFALHPFHQYLN